MKMVEKVARALCAKHYAKRFCVALDDPHVTANMHNWPNFKDNARTSIEAMREPTAEMWAAWEEHADTGDVEDEWRAMIDAALREDK
ncbi:MAG: hypothetical protein INF12_14730 [Methylobacterium sp.]|nr:hypothetical protein [Methylobacterium sp.]